MMHFGDKDAHIPLTDVDIIKSAQPDIDVFIYHADHGFNCDVRASYDEKSAATAKVRSLEFFATHLA
jgi:carboxymethylenebutenolidase